MDADRLEGPGRRVLPGAGLVAHRLADDPGELASPLDRARGDDGAGDAAGLRLLAIMVEDVGDFGFVGRVEELGGGLPFLAHTHVERPGRLEREAAHTLDEGRV